MEAKPGVLIVDDDGTNLALLEHGFGKTEYRLLRASNGLEGMEALHSAGQCDAIVLDRVMPRMGGLTLLRKLKRSPHYAGIPVVMQSLLDSPDERKEAMAAGRAVFEPG